LGLVQDDEGIIEGASAHEGQRRDLDGSPLEEAGGLFVVHHVVKGVIERAQVRVDFFRKVSRQKSQFLSSLHGRPHQYDASYQLFGHGRHRHGHRQIGFAGSRRPDAEDHIIVADGLDVFLLLDALGRNRPLMRGNKDVVEKNIFQITIEVFAENTDGIDNITIINRIAFLDQVCQLCQQPLGELHMSLFPSDAELIPSEMDPHVKLLFNDFEMAAPRSSQLLHQLVIVKNNLRRCFFRFGSRR